MQICQMWNGANSRTFQHLHVKFPELSRMYIDFQNSPLEAIGKGKIFQKIQELRRKSGSDIIIIKQQQAVYPICSVLPIICIQDLDTVGRARGTTFIQ